ncbi:MAG: CoA transferase [Chloroflexota bacterium]
MAQLHDGAFAGVRVVDFTWVAAGPATIKYLADCGATVIHVESGTQPEALRITPPFRDGCPGLNRSAYQAGFNNNKYGLSLNLNHPHAGTIIERLVRWADIIAESFTPGTVQRWGLDYESLVKIKPDIIMYSTCQQGQTGRHSRIAAYGTQLVSLAGFTHLTGWPDRGPTGPYGPYTDTPTPPVGAAAIAAALECRRRTGRGTHIDVSQYEAALDFIAPVLMDFTVNGEVAKPRGNRCEHAAPHGVFPCRGEDRWCAVAVFTEDEWRALCRVLDRPDWADAPEFSSLLRRKRNEERLEELLAEETVKYAAADLMARLQAAGVPAGVAEDSEQLQSDPQLTHRGYFRELSHREIGPHYYEEPPFILPASPAALNKAAPCLGEDTDYVCTEILGIPDAEFIALMAEGVFE